MTGKDKQKVGFDPLLYQIKKDKQKISTNATIKTLNTLSYIC